VTRSTLFALAAAGLVSAACSGTESKGTRDSAAASPSPASARSGGVDLTGAGATFPYPIYSKWISDYTAKTGIKINYQAIGSGGGIRQLSEGTVDFAGSDAPMTDEEMAKAKGGPIIHIPTVLGAVVITYNLPDVTQRLSLSGDVVADIFLGKITKWSDKALAADNPGKVQEDVSRIYKKVMDEKEEYQNKYDKETDFSRNKQKQAEWLEKIKDELDELDEYANYGSSIKV